MNYQLITSDRQGQISSFFSDVFSNSEGEAEGRLIGDLASVLAAEIDNQNIICHGVTEADVILGALFFTKLKFNGASNVYLLAPMAVKTERQKQGIGQRSNMPWMT